MVILLDAVVAVFAVLSGHIVAGDDLTGCAVEVLTKVNQIIMRQIIKKLTLLS